MNVEARQLTGAPKPGKILTKIFDVDIHPKSSVEDLRPYLSKRWWDHLQTFGARTRQGFLKGFPYPKSQPPPARRRQGICACAAEKPDQRPARKEAVLAGLRGGRGGRFPDRHPRLRHQRQGREQYRLAVVLYRGHDRACVVLPSSSHELDPG